MAATGSPSRCGTKNLPIWLAIITSLSNDDDMPGYSAATLAIRRLCSACSAYSLCHSLGPLDGETCTAVTLYSGQFVAQSENSVVTTLACVSGWWKVV